MSADSEACLRVIGAALSPATLSEWELFLEEAASQRQPAGSDSPPVNSAMYSIKEGELHRAFEAMIESRTRAICLEQGVAESDFHSALVELDSFPTVLAFKEVLVMAASLEVFCDVLRSRAKREYLLQILRGYAKCLEPPHK